LEWLFIIGLGGWVFLQSQRIGRLTRKLDELERRYGAGVATPAAAPTTAVPVTTADPALEPLVLDTPLPPEEEELLLDTPLPANYEEPLLLDTPVPDASNDIDEAPPIAAPLPPPQPAVLIPREEPIPAPPAPKHKDRRFEQWLARNGLAWLGGGAFALGAIYLVAVAAAQDWFTPVVQLWLAVALGVALLAVSELARRASIKRPPGHPLVAALLAGAGVVTFYAAAWAAHGPFRYIEFSTAAALLTLCAALLIALSYRHGQALGVLAIGMALLAPSLTDAPDWPTAGLTAFVCGVSAAGFALAALRRWAWVAAATVAGLYFWFAAAIGDDQIRRALALLSFASLGGIALAFRPPLEAEEKGYLPWQRLHTYLPAVAISISSVLLIWIWLASSPAPSGLVAGPAWVGAMFVALAAAAVRQRAAPPATFVVAVAALTGGFMVYLQSRYMFGPLGADFYPFVLFASVVVVISAIGAQPPREDNLLVSGTGAIGAGLLTVLAAFSRDDWNSLQAWAPLFLGAVTLFIAAWHTARDLDDPKTGRAIAFWTGAGAVLVLLGVESAFPAEARSAAHAGASLLFASAVAWRGWGSLRFAAVTAAAISIGHALSPSLIAPVLAGTIPLWGALTVLAATAALLFSAGYFAKRGGHAATGDALGSAGVIALIIAAFLALSWIAAGGSPTPRLDLLSEHGLRALILLCAGHIVMVRPGQEGGRISRWRGHVLFGAGLLYALMLPGLTINPWWGASPALVVGVPILDSLLLGFAAPAALALFAANRIYNAERFPARIYAIAGGALLLMWAALETRRLFHGVSIATPPVGLLEGACYALIFLAAALAVAVIARRRSAFDPLRPFTSDLVAATRTVAWGGVIASAGTLLIGRHPWWGAQDAAATTTLSTGFAVLAQFAAMVLALFLSRALSHAQPIGSTRFASASAAMLFGWSFGHAAIRWAYHGGAMDGAGALAGLEGFAHALWPLAFTLIAAYAATRAPGRDTIRQYLYDLQAICATAVWPALAFAALGLWVLFNPWWGIAPAQPLSTFTTVMAPATPIFAAWLSTTAPRVPHIRAREWFAPTAAIATIAHLFVAATLLVRWLYHRADMSAEGALDVEMWTYSGVWALFGAAVFALGLRRDDALQRWVGLVLLFGTAAKVILIDTAELAGIIRAASVLGLGVVLVGVAWIANNYKPPPPPGPGDLLTIKSSARREKRHGRRQRTS
jgi:uncharacterized membrane protein